jgi:hypothetical protein
MQTWEMSFNGRHWYDMPGNGSDEKKLNFAAWRRGLIKMDEVEMDAQAADGAGMALVTAPTQTTGLARANHRRAVAAARRGRMRIQVKEWDIQLSPSQRREKQVIRQQRRNARLQEKILQNARQQGLIKRWKALRLRTNIHEKPLQLLRELWSERQQMPERADGLLHGTSVLRDEAEAVVFDQCLDALEAALDQRDALRRRAEALARTVPLLGAKAVDFCRVAGVSEQVMCDVRRGNCRASGEKLLAMVAELERLAGRAKQKGGALV